MIRRTRNPRSPWRAALLALAACACDGGPSAPAAAPKPRESDAAAPNRIDIPSAVRTNLGMTFARVESRAVSRTLRLPGRFERTPESRRVHGTTVPGRVEILVREQDAVKAGTPLFHVTSMRWKELQERLAEAEAARDVAEAQLARFPALRDAQQGKFRAGEALAATWRDRLRQLEEVRGAGGGVAASVADATAALREAEAAVAVATGEAAEIDAAEGAARAARAQAVARLEILLGTAAAAAGRPVEELRSGWRAVDRIVVEAAADGVVESLGAASGAHVDETAAVVTLVDPGQVRLVAFASQTDVGRLRDGLAARIVPPGGGAAGVRESVPADIRIGLSAEAADRTMAVIASPRERRGWVRAGFAAHLDVTLEGGTDELSVPAACIVRDGVRPILFRRDPRNPDVAIRMDADLGISDGRFVVVKSGLREGDEVVLDGLYQLHLATAGSAQKAGHFHSDGTFHDKDD